MPSRALFWGPLLSMTAAIVCALLSSYLPTVDGPQYLYAAHTLAHYRELSTWYQPGHPLGAAGIHLLLLPLAWLLPWTLAYRATIALIVALWASGAWALARALHPTRAWVGVLTAVLAFQWALYMGMFSFVIGTAVGVWAIAVAVGEPRRRWVLPSLLLVALLCHLFAGLLAVAVVVGVRQVSSSPGERLRRLIPEAVVPLVAGLLVMVAMTGSTLDQEPAQSLAWFERVQALGKMMTGGPWWRCALPLLGALGGAVAALARGRPVERVLGAASLLGLAAALLSPLHIPGWMHFSPRFLPLATLVGLALLPLERVAAGPPVLALRALVAVWSAAALGWTAWFHHDLARLLRPSLAVLDAPVRRSGPRLPIVADDPWFVGVDSMERPYPYHDPLFNLPLLTAMNQGGVFPYTFTQSPAIHAFVARPGHPPFPPIPPREHFWLGLLDPEARQNAGLRRALLTDLAAHGSRYEDVILFGAGVDQEVLSSLGYTTEWRGEQAWIGVFQGCPTRLEVEAPEGAPARWTVEYGWLPLREAAWSTEVERAGQGATSLELPRTPCGPIWIEVRPAEPSAEAWRCQGAGKEGRVLRKPQATQRCVLRAMSP